MKPNTLVVMAKAPRAGKVKTRLAHDVGVGRATALFRIMLRKTIAETNNADWRRIIAIDPPSAAYAGWRHLLPPVMERKPQGGGDLGARMRRFVDGERGGGPIVFIGADAPRLRERHIVSAFQSLRGYDAVFGPAEDGGYWLIGRSRRRPAPHLFEGVRWSTANALADTMASLPSDFSIATLETLNDVDQARDLGALSALSTA